MNPAPPPPAGDFAADLDRRLAALTHQAAFVSGDGRGVRIGLLDGGLPTPDLAPHAADQGPAVARVVAQRVFRPDSPPGSPRGFSPTPSPHAMAVAGVITRLAPAAELVVADVLDPTGRGPLPAVLAGLDWLLTEGCHIINCSLGLTADQLPRAQLKWQIAELVERAYFSNCVLVAAAHNQAEWGVTAWPAALAPVVGVGKRIMGHDLTIARHIAPPNHGPLGGPRVEFDACPRSDHPDYAHHAASSFAAPHVTALIARLLGRYPGLKPFEVKTILHRAALSSP